MTDNTSTKIKAIEWLEGKELGTLELKAGHILLLKVERISGIERVFCNTPGGPCACIGIDMPEMMQRLSILDEDLEVVNLSIVTAILN